MSIFADHLRRLTACGVFAACSLLAGCADRQITTANVDQTIGQFENGSLTMNTSILEGGNGIFFVTKYENLANAQDWTGLSKLVIQVNSADDLGWFFLGLSAEKLGYPRAAIVYYENSVGSRVQYCSATLPDDTLCAGLRLPDAANARLSALQGQS